MLQGDSSEPVLLIDQNNHPFQLYLYEQPLWRAVTPTIIKGGRIATFQKNVVLHESIKSGK